MTRSTGLCDAIASAVALLAARDIKELAAGAALQGAVHLLPPDAEKQVL